MEADAPIAQRWDLMRERLDERQRRAFAAAEARVIGRGGVSQVAAATGVARNTIMAGMQELEGSSNEFVSGAALAPAGSTRRSGGGRKAATHKDPSLVPDLLALVDPTSRGDPESPLRWTCKSLRVLAEQPFTRDLYGIAVPPGVKRVLVQARDSKFGYGGKTVEALLPGRN